MHAVVGISSLRWNIAKHGLIQLACQAPDASLPMVFCVCNNVLNELIGRKVQLDYHSLYHPSLVMITLSTFTTSWFRPDGYYVRRLTCTTTTRPAIDLFITLDASLDTFLSRGSRTPRQKDGTIKSGYRKICTCIRNDR